MPYFLGCDVSKRKIDLSLINERGVEQWTASVANETLATATLLMTLAGHYLNDEVICVVEATGCYHHRLLEACEAVNVPCRVYNPILTKQGIKDSIRGKKTDKTDALLIARMGLRGEGRLHTPEPYRITRYAARAQQRLSSLSGSVKLYQNHVESVLGDDLTNAAHELLLAIQAQFAAARKQFVIDTATSAPPDLMRRLQTIPGVGPYIAASLIGEVQTMERFTTTKAFIAYAGLDPKIRQSGHSLNSTGRLTKRGSSYLRRSLFIAASIGRRYDPNLQALYDKKRAEEKPTRLPYAWWPGKWRLLSGQYGSVKKITTLHWGEKYLTYYMRSLTATRPPDDTIYRLYSSSHPIDILSHKNRQPVLARRFSLLREVSDGSIGIP